MVGGDVRITIVTSSAGQVKLAIEAPAALAIHREEVYERIACANRRAVAAALEGSETVEMSQEDMG